MGKTNVNYTRFATKAIASTLLFGSLLLPQATNAENMHKMSYPTAQTTSNTSYEFVNSTANTSETRLAGSSRYGTATAISKQGWQNGSHTIILATGRNFPDALAGTPLAFQYDAPILLTNTNTLTDDTMKEIKRLGAKHAILLGGSVAISEAVVTELKNMGVSYERIAGKSRADTAVEIAKKLMPSDKAIIVDGSNFPDAISIAPYAAREGIPIYLTQGGKLSEETEIELKKAKQIYVIGGSSAVNDSIVKEWDAIRITGKSRYETVAAVVNTFSFESSTTYIATGQAYADALTGSVLAAKQHAPMLLVPKNNVPAALKEVHSQENHLVVLGGASAVPQHIVEQLKEKPSEFTRSIADIEAKWEELKPRFDLYNYKTSVHPVLTAPYKVGKLKEEYLLDALNMTKFVRYLADVPFEDMVLDEALTNQAQHGALLLAVSEFSHRPAQPVGMSDEMYRKGYQSTSSSNISAGRKSIAASIQYGYMSDNWPAFNIESVGHRRWILNPSLMKLGFGEVETSSGYSYSTMQVFDTSRTYDYSYTNWPSEGHFPLEFFLEHDPWSIHLAPVKFKAPKLANVTVTLTRKSDKKVWSFNASNNDNAEDRSKNYLNVSNDRYGDNFSIIFRPANLKIHEGDTFEVTVQGMETTDGIKEEITYTVNFFNLKNY